MTHLKLVVFGFGSSVERPVVLEPVYVVAEVELPDLLRHLVTPHWHRRRQQAQVRHGFDATDLRTNIKKCVRRKEMRTNNKKCVKHLK
jgi:hypothetical protein